MRKENSKHNKETNGGIIGQFLNVIETVGNKLPDPAILFLISMLIVWVLSWLMSSMTFSELDPRTGTPLVINDQLTGSALATFLSRMVTTFTGFAPLGVVLVAMLGVGVAEHSGYINAGLKLLLKVTPKMLLTPMLVFVGILSHSAVDAGYVLVIPLGGVIFYAAGRHPLAGICAAFAGVSGGFSANPVPSALDPLLQGFTQQAAQIVNETIMVNPLCNYYFTAASSILIVGLAWFLTDRVIEPRLNKTSPIDADTEEAPDMESIEQQEKNSFLAGTIALATMLVGLLLVAWQPDSPLRDANGNLDTFQAPLMQSIVPLIFLFFLVPGVIYGFMAGTFKKSKDVIDKMSKSMSDMAYYIVMAFFCSLFIYAFAQSNIGALLAIKGGSALREMALPSGVTIAGLVGLTAFVNLFVGSASAKWALLAPIFVPMLMKAGISPELTQAAYRVGDSSSNIITPLMPYFPLVVVFCQRYYKKTGIGTLVSLMLPYAIVFIILWSIFLVIFMTVGVPLGIQAGYTYP